MSSSTHNKYLKSESECDLIIITSEVDIKQEDDCYISEEQIDSEQTFTLSLSCPNCVFRTSLTSKLDEHLLTHAPVCKECVEVGCRYCKIHRFEYFQGSLEPNDNSEKQSKGKCKKKRSRIPSTNTRRQRWLKKKCEKCSYVCCSSSKLKKHYLHFHGKINSCSNCHYQPVNIADLEQHLRSHAIEDAPFQCTICTFETPWKLDFEEHRITHIKPKQTYDVGFVCDICEYKVSNKTKFERHMVGHLKMCTLCRFMTLHESFLERHSYNHRPQPLLYRCKLCPFETSKELIFEMHVEDHKAFPLKSAACAYKTRDVSFFDLNVNDHHSVVCKFCTTKFDDITTLQIHVKGCHKRLLHKCNLCKYRTNVKRLLYKHHIKAHVLTRFRNSKQPFVCNTCTFTTQLKYTYDLHKKFRHGEEIHRCSRCPYRTLSIAKLLKHRCLLRVLECEVCGLAFTNRGLLEKHLSSHDFSTLLADFKKFNKSKSLCFE